MRLLGKKRAPSAEPPRQMLTSGMAGPRSAGVVTSPRCWHRWGCAGSLSHPGFAWWHPGKESSSPRATAMVGRSTAGCNPAPLPAAGVFSEPRLHRTGCGIQHGSSAAAFCPQSLMWMGARGPNGLLGTMGSWGQAQGTAALRHGPARMNIPLAQPQLSHLLPAPLPVRSGHLSWYFGGSEHPRIGEDPSAPRQGDPNLYQRPRGAVCETSRGEKHHWDGLLGHPDVSRHFSSPN